MNDRSGIFAGDDPFEIARAWLRAAEASEINDPNAIALATIDPMGDPTGDPTGLPNVRMVLLKGIEADGFLFYTNYDSAKGQEIAESGKAAFVAHWKSLRRQLRVRGLAQRADGPQADAYYASRTLQSRLGAWASLQSRPLRSRAALMGKVAAVGARYGLNPPRPPFWGGFRITPLEIEFWAEGAHRLHDRFQWRRSAPEQGWSITRLNP